MTKMITIKNLSFQFEQAPHPLFSDVHYSFPEGKLTFIEGKNGAGKSTLFQILMAQPEIQSHVTGSLSYQGTTYDLAQPEYTHFVQRHISRVCQRFDELLVPHLTFQENLACARFAPFPSATSPVVLPEIPTLADTLHIPTDTPVQLLSGGQRQILAILMVLQRSSSILLLDEPTATLDEENSQLVMHFICSLIQKQNLTVLMISHDSSLYSYTTTEPLIITKNRTVQ